MKKSHSKAGMGIMEVLIAIGLFAILAVGLASFMTNGMKQQRGIQAKDQQREITAELRTLLNNRTACANSFGGIDPSGAGSSVSSVKDSVGVDRYNLTTKSTDKTGLLKFTDFRVSNWTLATGNADLQVKLSKTGETGTALEIRPDIITLKAKVDGSGNITECFSIGTVTDGFWQIGTNPSDIVFNAGNVGIGTMTPAAKLEVAGGIRPIGAVPDTLCSPLGSLAYNSATGAPLYCNNLGKWTGGAGAIKTMEKRAGPFNTYNGGDSLACDAGWVMTSCRAEIDTSDGQSLHIRNRFEVDQDPITGNVIGCHTRIRLAPGDRLMYDGPGGDTLIIVIMCVQ